MSQKSLKRPEKLHIASNKQKKHKWRNDHYEKEKPKDPEWQTKTQGARHLTAAALWG